MYCIYIYIYSILLCTIICCDIITATTTYVIHYDYYYYYYYVLFMGTFVFTDTVLSGQLFAVCFQNMFKTLGGGRKHQDATIHNHSR